MRVLLLTSFVLLHALAIAQTPRKAQPPKSTKTARPTQSVKPAQPAIVYKDVVHKLDKSMLTVKIDELTETSVIYREPANPTVKQTLPRAEVWKVVFSDGSVESITPLPEEKVVITPTQSTVSQGTSNSTAASAAASYTKPGTTARYRPVRTFGRLNLTVGPEGSLFSLGKQSQWTNDFAGLGMSQSIGASLRIDYRFVKALALSVTGGYARWQLIRNYNQAGVEKYDETVQLTRIPVMAGLKIYAGNLYILPEGGINLLTETTSTSGAHPKPTNQQTSATPITYGGSLGYEFHLGMLLIDLSGRYQILDIKALSVGTTVPALTEKIQFGSLRVGIGFTALKK